MKDNTIHAFSLASFVQNHLSENDMRSIDLLHAMGYSNFEHSYRELRQLIDRQRLKRNNSFFHRLRAYFHNSETFKSHLACDIAISAIMVKGTSKFGRKEADYDFKPLYFVHHEFKYPIGSLKVDYFESSIDTLSYTAEGIIPGLEEYELVAKAHDFIVNVLPSIAGKSHNVYGKRRYVVLWYEHKGGNHKAIAFDLKGQILTKETLLGQLFENRVMGLRPPFGFPYVKSSTLEGLGITPPIEKDTNSNTGGADESI